MSNSIEIKQEHFQPKHSKPLIKEQYQNLPKIKTCLYFCLLQYINIKQYTL